MSKSGELVMKIQFYIGQEVTNSQIQHTFEVSPQGGMRRSKTFNCLVLISKESNNFYPDKWDGDTLMYSGMGQHGDQSDDYKQNRTLRDSNQTHIPVFLFINIGVNEYIYYGRVVLTGSLSTKIAPDDDGNARKVVIFPIKPVSELDKIHHINAEIISKQETYQEKRVKKMSKGTLINMISKHQQFDPLAQSSKRKVTKTEFFRSPEKRKLAKLFANGRCQLCGELAPFNDNDNNPFLEVHHIQWLSRGGRDILENVIALCPNCHRKMHIVQDPSDIKMLTEKARGYAASVGLLLK